MGRLRTRPRPFVTGSAIRSNALLLQLDPDNPDEEAEEIARLARAHQQQLEDALQAQLAHISAGNNAFEIQALADSLPESDLRLALETLLRESAGRGAIVTAEKLTQIAVGVNWQLANEMARIWANQYSYELVSYITSNSRQFIAAALADWVQSGAPLSDLIAQLGTRFDATRAELIASTEATRAYAEGSFTLYEQAGFNTRPPAGDRPPAHPRCILPGTKVLPLGPISAAAKSLYVGRCIEVTLGNGSKISVTENHPILTPAGWVQAQRIRQGDDVLYAADAERIASAIDPNNDHRPTAIEEIFRAIEESGVVTTRGMPVSPVQFHGDGRRLHGDVNIVYVDSLLLGRDQTSVLEHEAKSGLDNGRIGNGVLLTDSLLNLDLVRQGDTTHRVMGGSDHSLPFAFGSISPTDIHAFGDAARGDADFDDASAKGATIHTRLSRKFLLGFSSQVTTEKVVEVRDFFFSGHVYDLQCDMYELYTGNGFIVKNCRCFVSLAEMEPGMWHYVWYTAQDERVCPTCGARHLQSIGFAGRR